MLIQFSENFLDMKDQEICKSYIMVQLQMLWILLHSKVASKKY